MKNTTRTTRHDHGNRTLFPQRKAFVLRFTADAGPQTGAFRGRVEHVSSGDVSTFESPEQLWAFVRDELTTSR